MGKRGRVGMARMSEEAEQPVSEWPRVPLSHIVRLEGPGCARRLRDHLLWAAITLKANGCVVVNVGPEVLAVVDLHRRVWSTFGEAEQPIFHSGCDWHEAIADTVAAVLLERRPDLGAAP